MLLECHNKNHIGHCYQNGIGVEKNIKEAIKYYKLAGKNDNLQAMYSLGKLCLHEIKDSSEYDRILALRFLIKAADKGYVPAQVLLEKVYDVNDIGKENLNEEFNIIKNHATVHGSMYCQNLLGKLYQKGICCDIDYQESLNFFEMSAKSGYHRAQLELGLIYFYGTGVDPNPKLAFEYFQKASTSEDRDNSPAIYYLALCYQKGIGVEKNTQKAYENYMKSAKAGYPKSLFSLGHLLFYGLDFPENKAEGLQYMQKAAEKGFDKAKEFLNNKN